MPDEDANLLEPTAAETSSAAADEGSLVNPVESPVTYHIHDGVDSPKISFNNLTDALDVTPLTTKGDLFTFDTNEARLPVGNDDEILSSYATATTGLKWVPPFFYGDGSEGDLTATGATDTNPTRATLNDAVAAGQKVFGGAGGLLTSSFSVGDHVLLMQMVGTGAGLWEIAKIASKVTSTSLTMEQNLKNSYQAQYAQCVLIPEYNQVAFKTGASLSNATWLAGGTNTGGISVLYAKKGIVIETGVTLTMNAKGCRGGPGQTGLNFTGYRGEGTAGDNSVVQSTPNGTGGGGGPSAGSPNAGSGGGLRVVGTDGNSAGGGLSFVDALTDYWSGDGRWPTLLMGGGGGGGGSNVSPDPKTSATGGNGGGIIFWIAPFIINLGTVTANGGNGANGQGGDTTNKSGSGAGGTIFFCSPHILNIITPTATGGTFAPVGGDGFYFQGLLTGMPTS